MNYVNFRKIRTLILVMAVAFFIFECPAFASDVKVAILDSGAMGYVDSAVSFTSLSANQDPLRHGTEIAKLIRQGNPSLKIYMLQVCEEINGEFKPSRDAILEAIRWSVENGIHIVNMSLVIPYDKEIENAISAATSHGVLFVAAAGNKTLASHFAADSHGYVYKTKKLVKPAFPASNKNVIAVGGLDQNDKLAGYSDKTCDVYASGKILGQEGSSFACARITARAAQILSHHPAFTKEALLSYLK